MRYLRTQAVTVVLVVLAVYLVDGGLVAQTRAEQEKQREQWQRVPDIFRAMGVRAGATVADVGAGDGFFTSRLARAVGPSGRVFAVDVNDAQIDRLRRRLTDESLENVTVIRGTATDPQLPAGTLDAALIINAYHEMAEHQAMLEAIRSALKPAGRLVIVEPISASRRTATRAEQTREHEIAPEYVLQDARTAGLRIVGLEDPFTTRGRATEWMMTVTPSAAATIIAAGPAPARSDTTSRDWRDPGLRISVEELVKITTSGSATIIDVRDEGVFAEGHIPNAVLIPIDEIESSVDRLRALKQPLVTYCS